MQRAMKKQLILITALMLGFVCRLGYPQTPTTGKPAAGLTGPFKLEDATPVKLRLQRNLSSADAQTGDRVDFDALEEITVNGVVVIPKGSIAWGTITEAQAKRRMGRGGKLDVNIDAVRLADGEKCALRAVKEGQGGSHTGAMTAGIVATALVAWPAAPVFLLMHGKDITIPEGTEITAYVNGDTKLDLAKFTSPPAPPLTASAPAAPPSSSRAVVQSSPPPPVPPAVASIELSTVVVKSEPDGADITVDGKYVGSTPSTVRLSAGDHTVAVEKAGLKTWQRTMTVSPGGILTISAALEHNP